MVGHYELDSKKTCPGVEGYNLMYDNLANILDKEISNAFNNYPDSWLCGEATFTSAVTNTLIKISTEGIKRSIENIKDLEKMHTKKLYPIWKMNPKNYHEIKRALVEAQEFSQPSLNLPPLFYGTELHTSEFILEDVILAGGIENSIFSIKQIIRINRE